MSSKRYAEEFKIEAVRQVTERGHSVAEVSSRLGTTTHSLYAWIRKYGPNAETMRTGYILLSLLICFLVESLVGQCSNA